MLKTPDFLISLNNVGLKRGSRWLVRGVSLTVERGEIVTLIGPNGSGKSTTAKLALNILEADEGTISKAPDLRIGYVPQRLSIDWTLPLPVSRFMQLTEKISARQAAEVMEATGISHLKDQELRTLSGGEFQRVLLARAIARKPDLLVLDEPVQGVDFSGEIELYNLIKEHRDRLNCGILLISHDLHLVMAETDRVICLNGHVCCAGSPKSVASSPEYKALFGAHAASAFAVYEHQHDHTHMPDGRVKHADGTITDHCHPEDGHHDHHGHVKKGEEQNAG